MLTILDGGLGTELARRGLDTETVLWSTVALLDERGRLILRRVHLDYLDAGADVLTANTFRTNRRALDHAGIGDRFVELVETAVGEARRARDEGGRSDIRIAGSMAPLEDCYRPDLSPPRDVALAEHAEHARALAGAGCDLLLVETVSAKAEGLAATEAAVETGLPVWVSALVHPRTPRETLETFFRDAAERGASAVLLNCTPAGAIDAMLDTTSSANLPFGAYAHMGAIDPAVGWDVAETLTPSDYRERARVWISRGATIVGGCCGTTPAHVEALVELRFRG